MSATLQGPEPQGPDPQGPDSQGPDPHSRPLLRPLPRFEPSTHDGNTPHRAHLVRRSTPHDGRSGRTRPRSHIAFGRTTGTTAPARNDEADAHRFAQRVVRLVLEVADGRRPAAQLSGFVVPPVAAAVAAARRPTDAGDSAVLLRLRVRSTGSGCAELFGSYGRGPRVFAVAGRVTRPRAHPRTRATLPAPHGWLLTNIWLG